jgi:hypothetical protein
MNKLTYFVVALGLILSLACGEKTTPLIVCHNSNCVEPPEPKEDDSLEALQASLQLRSTLFGMVKRRVAFLPTISKAVATRVLTSLLHSFSTICGPDVVRARV